MGSEREASKDRTSAKKLVLLLLLCSYHSLVARAGYDAHIISKVFAIGLQKAEAVCAEPQGTDVYNEIIHVCPHAISEHSSCNLGRLQ
jgi:hypothetical protein